MALATLSLLYLCTITSFNLNLNERSEAFKRLGLSRGGLSRRGGGSQEGGSQEAALKRGGGSQEGSSHPWTGNPNGLKRMHSDWPHPHLTDFRGTVPIFLSSDFLF